MNRATTIRLERVEDGVWRATQRGVELVGRGSTAARAAARYCELVAETGDAGEGAPDDEQLADAA